MLNPFLFGMDQKPVKDVQAGNDEQIAHAAGRPVVWAAPRHPLTLLLGKLLIRMGSKLIRENPQI